MSTGIEPPRSPSTVPAGWQPPGWENGPRSTARSNSGLAIASLVLGLVGLLLSWFTFGIPSLLALIFGIVGIRQTAGPRGLAGRGMAVTGTVLGGIMLAVGVWISAVIIYSVGSTVGQVGNPTTSATAATTPASVPSGTVQSTSEQPTAPAVLITAAFGTPVDLTVDGEPAGSYRLDPPVIAARGGEFDPVPTHGAYVSTRMTVKALPGRTLDFNPFFEFYVRDSAGARYDATFLPVKEPAMKSGTARPGRPASGWVTFDAPAHGTIVLHGMFDDLPIAEWKY